MRKLLLQSHKKVRTITAGDKNINYTVIHTASKSVVSKAIVHILIEEAFSLSLLTVEINNRARDKARQVGRDRGVGVT